VTTSSKKSSNGNGTTTLAKALSNYYGKPSSIGTNVTMTADQVSTMYKNLDNAQKLDAQIKQQEAEKQAIVAGNKAAARNNKKKK
jgi:hypothetical protein